MIFAQTFVFIHIGISVLPKKKRDGNICISSLPKLRNFPTPTFKLCLRTSYEYSGARVLPVNYLFSSLPFVSINKVVICRYTLNWMQRKWCLYGSPYKCSIVIWDRCSHKRLKNLATTKSGHIKWAPRLWGKPSLVS